MKARIAHYVHLVCTTREPNLVIIGALDGALELLRHIDRLRGQVNLELVQPCYNSLPCL
jgi:hypothetical protein